MTHSSRQADPAHNFNFCRDWTGDGPTQICFRSEGLDPAKPTGKPKNPFIHVEVRGRLRHGVVAIGGEHTGTSITANGIAWELDLHEKEAFRAQAEALDGQLVIAKGSLAMRKGLEVPKRQVVTVKSLNRPRPRPQP